ncbi:MAG: ATP-binding cassette domain-containing protein [Oligoflexia bacterium]|nr:ATP-binding cassette domain-containing protein [Oligoflexia bacterium]
MSPIISVNNLCKHFNVKERGAGISSALSSFFKPRYRVVQAVENISFEVQAGERVAFIGPNGAGKSTTIKMLTGILFPSSGSMDVLGYNPSEQRKELALHIGIVFGQRPQLWYHLPAIDTLRFLARIYELNIPTFTQRLRELSVALELEPLLNVPVRKLSLGQRMRCEVAASLLHRPKVIFLDEPTIGLDVIAKQQIRSFIRELNERDQTTIFLTSHDASDIELLAQRTIVIGAGRLLFDDSTENFVRTYIRSKTIEIILRQPSAEIRLPAGRLVKHEPFRIMVEVDTRTESIESLLSYAVNHFQIQDINIYDPDMEEVIRTMYSENRLTGSMR